MQHKYKYAFSVQFTRNHIVGYGLDQYNFVPVS